MKRSRLKIKSKNLFKKLIKAYILISTILFFIASNGWCQESVGQAKGKDKVIDQIVNSAVPSAYFIEYLLYRLTSISLSITQKFIDQEIEIVEIGDGFRFLDF